MTEAGRAAEICRQRSQAYQETRKKLSVAEKTQLAVLSQSSDSGVTLNDCLDLIDPSDRTKPIHPQKDPNLLAQIRAAS